MRKKYILIAVLLLIPLLLTGCLSNDDASNKNPVIKSLNLSSQTMRVDKSIDVSVQASDPDGDKIGYSWSVTKGKITGSGANVTYQAPSKAGTYEIKVLVSDGKGGKVTSSKEIQVASNDSPVINSVTLNPTTIQVEETATITVDASDPEGDSLIYAYNVSNGSISGTGNNATYTAPSSTGTYTIEVTVSDGSNNVSASKEITVNEPVWQALFGENTDGDRFNDVIATSDGGFLLVGSTKSYAASYEDGYIVKVDNKGNQEWYKTYGNRSELFAIKETSDGNYILTGVYNDGTNDKAYLLKIDSQGNKIWSNTFMPSGNTLTVSHDVIETSNGGYLLVGRTNGSSFDSYIVKTDASGNKLWSKVYSTTNREAMNSVVETSSGNYLVAGYKESTNYDGYLLKIDDQGNKVWEKTYDSGSGDKFNTIAKVSDGNYILTGHYNGENGALIKVDDQGNEIWSNTYFTGELHDVIETSDGYLAVGYEDVNAWDFAALKVDPSGAELWSKNYGGTREEEALGVTMTNDGGFVLVGWSYSFNSNWYEWAHAVKADSQGNTGSSPQ